MKLNMNKCCFLIISAISIGLCISLFAISLVTTYSYIQYISITLAFIQSMYVVKTIHKYPLWIKK